VATEQVKEAWVKLVDEEALRARMPEGGPRHPYDFGFLAPMARLTAAHSEIGPKFSALFAQIMFAPGALTRQEREMIAGIAAAAQDCYY
jgi:alkylhydroperoxidase/carboxymuconolactone decarboxylase family protein YurZ